MNQIIPNSTNVLNLAFDDAEEELEIPERKVILFDNEMAQQIIQFTENNLDKNLFVVHCLMGMSRSGAVGGWLADRFEIRWEDFKLINPRVKPNSLVKTTLQQTYYTFLDERLDNK